MLVVLQKYLYKRCKSTEYRNKGCLWGFLLKKKIDVLKRIGALCSRATLNVHLFRGGSTVRPRAAAFGLALTLSCQGAFWNWQDSCECTICSLYEESQGPRGAQRPGTLRWDGQGPLYLSLCFPLETWKLVALFCHLFKHRYQLHLPDIGYRQHAQLPPCARCVSECVCDV